MQRDALSPTTPSSTSRSPSSTASRPDVASTGKVEKVDGANAFDRGGLLRLGAVLTTTSAPLRTSPVKRGDWVLRRILGTPTPPPPADAGIDSGRRQDLRRPDAPRAAGAAQAQRDLRHLPPAHRSARLPARRLRRRRPRSRRRTPTAKPSTITGELTDKTTIVGADGLLKYLDSQDTQVMTTLSRKMLGYALGRTVLASDQPLIDRHGRGRRRRVVRQPGREDRHQPSVPQPRRSTTTSRPRRKPIPTRSRTRPVSAVSNETDSSVSRRGVTSCAAPASRWRCPGWSRCRSSAQAATTAASGQHAAAAPRHRLLLERRRADSLVGQGQRRAMELGPAAAADDAASARTWSSSGAVQPGRLRLDQPAPRPHEPALRRHGQPRPERDPRRHVDGPGPRRSRSAAAPRSRASCSASSRTSCGSKTACR